jgi:ferric-dicitrate binding protein FerR (iron transport regulator)
MTDIEDCAIRWVIASGDGLSAERQLELERWLAADTRHRALFVRAKASWERQTRIMSRLRPLNGIVDPDLLANVPKYW